MNETIHIELLSLTSFYHRYQYHHHVDIDLSVLGGLEFLCSTLSTQRGTYTILSSVSKNVLSFLKVFLFFLCLSFFRFSLGVLFYPLFYEFLLLMLVYLILFFFFFTHVLVYFLPPREEDAYEMTIRAFLPFLVLARE